MAPLYWRVAVNHVRGEAGIYGQAVQRGVDAQDMLGNIYEGPGGGTGEPAVFGFAEVPGILSGYHLGVNVGLCPVNLTDVFDVGRAGLFVYFKGPVAVADDGLADGDPGVVVAEDTGILFVSGRIGGDFAKVEVIGGRAAEGQRRICHRGALLRKPWRSA